MTDMRTSTRILVSGTLFISLLVGANLTAQTAPPPSAKGGHSHAAAEQNPSCQRILTECKNLGFIQGQWKKDNGLWKDCFDPIVKGNGAATRDGKSINVPVSSSDVQACRASAGHHK
jgi:hypothetical protein